MKELRPLLVAGGLMFAALLVGLVSLHEKHYSSRHMRILDAKVKALAVQVESLQALLTEDRTT